MQTSSIIKRHANIILSCRVDGGAFYCSSSRFSQRLCHASNKFDQTIGHFRRQRKFIWSGIKVFVVQVTQVIYFISALFGFVLLIGIVL